MVHCSKFVVVFEKFSSFFIGSNTTNLRLRSLVIIMFATLIRRL